METNFNVAKSDLLKGLQVVGPVINPKMTLPALNYIFCEVKGSKLLLIGNNIEQQIETSVDILESTSDCTFNADKVLIDSLKSLPEQPLEVNVNVLTGILLVKHYSGEIKVHVTGEEYPKMKDDIDNEFSFSLSAVVLKRGLLKNHKQMANDELRSVMNGIYFDITPDNIVFVASDGHRLSKFVDNSVKGLEKQGFILNRNAVSVLIKMLSSIADETEIEVKVNKRNIVILIEHVIFTIRLIEGRYPNYNSVIPQNNPIEMIIDSDSVSSVLSRLLVLSNANSKLIKVDANEQRTILSAEDVDLNQGAREKLDCVSNKPIVIGYKGTFLHELLSNFDGEVKIALSEPSKASLFCPVEQEENTEYTLLLMPLMLNN